MRLAAALLAALLPLGLSACMPEDIGGSFVIVNDWDQPVYHATKRIDPDGGTYKIGISDGCGSPGPTLYDEQDNVVVRLDEWCSGQTLTIRGPGDFTVKPDDTQ